MELRREGDSVIIKMSSPELAEELECTINYAKVLELSRGMKTVPQEEVDKLADDIKRQWWNDNRSRFIQ